MEPAARFQELSSYSSSYSSILKVGSEDPSIPPPLCQGVIFFYKSQAESRQLLTLGAALFPTNYSFVSCAFLLRA